MSRQNAKTPVMVLQEFAVKNRYPPPDYILVKSKTGTHEDEFYFKVDVGDVSGAGSGRSKQAAKHQAASNALQLLADKGLHDPSPAQKFNEECDGLLKPPVNFVGPLKDLCGELKLPFPEFNELSEIGLPNCRQFTCECKVSSFATQATANSKKQAKQLTAKDMFEIIKKNHPELAKRFSLESELVTDHDNEDVNKQNELSCSSDVIPNRVITITDFSKTLRKIIKEKNMKFEDFKEQFQNRSQAGLDYIFQILGVKYRLNFCQECLPIAVASFDVDTNISFSIKTIGSSEERAIANLIGEIFTTLDVYVNLLDDCD